MKRSAGLKRQRVSQSVEESGEEFRPVETQVRDYDALDVRHSLETLAAFLECCPNPLMRISEAGTVLYANGASEPLLKKWAAELSENGSRHPMGWVQSAMQRAEPFYIEEKCGAVVYRLGFFAVEQTGFVNVYGSDITLHKRGEALLAQTEERYRAALDAVEVGIWELDLKRNVVCFSARTAELYGLEEGLQEIDLHELLTIVHPEDLGAVREALGAHLNGQEPRYRKEFRVVYGDGSIAWVEGSGRVVAWDECGSPCRMLGTCRDITRDKQVESDQIRLQNLKSLGILAGGIAHDFNNILMGIFGNISLAKRLVREDHPASELLGRAESAMPRATKLTGQLLTFAKGGAPITDRVHLEDVVEEVVRFDLMGSNVKPLFEVEPRLWHGEVDQSQIHQVISVLVMNAREAMPGGGELRVSLRNATVVAGELPGLTRGKYIQVDIADTGVGIAQKDQVHVFDPYYTTKSLGHGLGLSTAHSIIKRHGGGIYLESEVGQGATFTFYLPANENEVAEPAPIASVKAGAKKLSIRALLLDDEEMIRLVVPRMLEKEGITTDCVATGDEAVAVYREAMESDNPFDVVILDLTIPGEKGGVDVVQHLLEMDPSVKAIVTSGYAGDAVVSNYKSYGFKGFIVKPFLRAELLEVVHKVLEA
jgi:PAS domain S-box-containing protein